MSLLSVIATPIDSLLHKNAPHLDRNSSSIKKSFP